MTARTRALRVAGGSTAAAVFFLESACSSGHTLPPASGAGASAAASAAATATAPPSSTFRESSSAPSPVGSQLEAYERARAKAWDPSRRFKALFRAEVSPKVGAIGHGWLSVWWDGASGTLAWRASAPIAGSGRGGLLRKATGAGGDARFASPVPGHLAQADLLACILGTPDAPLSPSTRADAQGRVVEMRFPSGEVVELRPGEGVPRRIQASGPDGRAVLTLESYGPWPSGEEVPPP